MSREDLLGVGLDAEEADRVRRAAAEVPDPMTESPAPAPAPPPNEEEMAERFAPVGPAPGAIPTPEVGGSRRGSTDVLKRWVGGDDHAMEAWIRSAPTPARAVRAPSGSARAGGRRSARGYLAFGFLDPIDRRGCRDPTPRDVALSRDLPTGPGRSPPRSSSGNRRSSAGSPTFWTGPSPTGSIRPHSSGNSRNSNREVFTERARRDPTRGGARRGQAGFDRGDQVRAGPARRRPASRRSAIARSRSRR